MKPQLNVRVAVCLAALAAASTAAGQQPSSNPLPAVALGEPSSPAGPPRVVSMSGTLVDAGGRPQAGSATLTFALCAEEQGGAPLWSETQTVQADERGKYAVWLGTVTPLPLEAFQTTEARWLGVVNGGAGERPRVRLVSVPYALKAGDAETLGGLPASAYALAAAADSGTGGSTATADDPAPSPKTILAGALNLVAKYMTTFDVGPSAIYDGGGLIGINTTAPLDILHARFTNTNGTMTGVAVQNLGSTATSYSGMLFYDQNGLVGQFQGFNNSTHEYRINNVAPSGSINFMIGASSKFLVANSGNIGVGVPTPVSKLDVAGDVNLAGTLKFYGSTVLNAVGNFNTAVGHGALASTNPLPAESNTAVGRLALNLTNRGDGQCGCGYSNTAIGSEAMRNNTTGSGNIAIGVQAGYDVSPVASNNIFIGSPGALADSGTIRIGRTYQTSFFAAGVRGVTTGSNDAVPVVIDSNGQLGTVSSSAPVQGRHPRHGRHEQRPDAPAARHLPVSEAVRGRNQAEPVRPHCGGGGRGVSGPGSALVRRANRDRQVPGAGLDAAERAAETVSRAAGTARGDRAAESAPGGARASRQDAVARFSERGCIIFR